MPTINLKIISDINCDIYIDDAFIITAKKEQVEVISLVAGEYYLKCIGAYSPDCKIEQIFELSSPKVIRVTFEELIKSHPEWMRDTNFAYSLKNQSFYHIATGKDITNTHYESGDIFVSGRALAQRDGKWGYVDKMGAEIVPCEYVDKSMMFREIVACGYERIDEFHNGLAAARSSDHLYGFIDESGVEVIPCSFTNCTPFNKGLAGVENGDTWCFINVDGNEIGQFYDFISVYLEGFFKVRRGDKYGIVDSEGSEVLLCIYDEISDFNDDFAKICKDDKYGLINRDVFVFTPCVYTVIKDYKDDLALVMRDGKYGLINRDGIEVIPCEYSGDIEFIDDISIVSRDGEWGVINLDNREVVPFKYGGISKFINGIAYIRDHGGYVGVFDAGKYGIVDITGREVVPCKYSSISRFIAGRAMICYNGKYGYIDTSGVEVLSPQYDYIGEFVQGIAQVKKGNLYGYIDTSGTEIIPCAYSKMDEFIDGFAKVEQGGKQGIVASNGKEIVPCLYSYIYFSHGIAQVKNEEDLWGIFDSKGYVISPCIYDEIREADRAGFILGLIKDMTLPAYLDNRGEGMWRLFSEMSNDEFETLWKQVSNQVWSIKDDEILTEKKAFVSNYIDGLAIVKVIVNKKHFYSIISHNQGLILPCIYSDIVNVSSDLFRIALGGTLGLVNKNGEEVVPCKYSWIDVFKNGYAIVRVGGPFVTDIRKYGLIDSFGYECIPCQYESIKEAGDNTYLVNLNGKWGIVNDRNEVLLDFKYDWVDEFKDGRAKVKVEVKHLHPWGENVYHWGLIADDGRELIPCVCNKIVDFKQDTYEVGIDGFWGLADKYGNTIISCQYKGNIIDFNDGVVRINHSRNHDSLIKQIPFKNVPISRHTKILHGGTLIKVCRNGMYGCQDIDGVEIVPCKYWSIDDFVEGLAKAYGKEGYGYINIAGDEVIPCLYHSIGQFVDGYAIISKIDGYEDISTSYKIPKVKYGIVNLKGDEIVLCVYDKVHLFEEGMSSVMRDGKWGFVDMNGKLIISLKYDAVKPFKEGLAAVNTAGKWGFVNMYGQEIVPCIYDDARSFHDGFAYVGMIYDKAYWINPEDEGYYELYKCGFIDRSGCLLVPLQYDSVKDFNDGYAIVRQEDKYGIIDTKGSVVLPCIYENIEDQEVDFAYRKNGERNYIAKQNNLRILNYYDECCAINSDTLRCVRKNGYWGLIALSK